MKLKRYESVFSEGTKKIKLLQNLMYRVKWQKKGSGLIISPMVGKKWSDTENMEIRRNLEKAEGYFKYGSGDNYIYYGNDDILNPKEYNDNLKYAKKLRDKKSKEKSKNKEQMEVLRSFDKKVLKFINNVIPDKPNFSKIEVGKLLSLSIKPKEVNLNWGGSTFIDVFEILGISQQEVKTSVDAWKAILDFYLNEFK